MSTPGTALEREIAALQTGDFGALELRRSRNAPRLADRPGLSAPRGWPLPAAPVSPRQAFELLFFDYMGLSPGEMPVVEETPDRIAWLSDNPCPTLEACAGSASTRGRSAEPSTSDRSRPSSAGSTRGCASSATTSAIRPHAPHCRERSCGWTSKRSCAKPSPRRGPPRPRATRATGRGAHGRPGARPGPRHRRHHGAIPASTGSFGHPGGHRRSGQPRPERSPARLHLRALPHVRRPRRLGQRDHHRLRLVDSRHGRHGAHPHRVGAAEIAERSPQGAGGHRRRAQRRVRLAVRLRGGGERRAASLEAYRVPAGRARVLLGSPPHLQMYAVTASASVGRSTRAWRRRSPAA